MSLLLGILVGSGVSGTLAAAQQFSADLTGNAAGASPGKIYVSHRMVRIEISAFAGGLFLLDGGAHTSYFVKPPQRLVMDAKQSTWLTQMLVPLDPDDPCRQWQAMAEIAGAADQGRQWRCDRLGPESTRGRVAIKYRATPPVGPASYCWIDPQLGFVVSVHRDDDTVVDLENVQEGPSPIGLFEIPGNFRTFDPHQLIDRIKQSDVWVESPR